MVWKRIYFSTDFLFHQFYVYKQDFYVTALTKNSNIFCVLGIQTNRSNLCSSLLGFLPVRKDSILENVAAKSVNIWQIFKGLF